MAFYISPPNGHIHIEEFLYLARSRLEFLHRLMLHHDAESGSVPWEEVAYVQNSEAVIEMTPKDIMSHFLLRICATFSRTFSVFFIESETRLFETRYKHFSVQEKQQSFEWVRRQIKRVERKNRIGAVYSDFYKWLLRLVRQLALSLNRETNEVVFQVPFQHVLDLVHERAVCLSRGMALIEQKQLATVWTVFFKSYLNLAVQHESESCMLRNVKEDPRIMAVVNHLLDLHFRTASWEGSDSAGRKISANQVDSLVDRFPLCMQHVHHKLRQCHRLPHHSRIQYTLFLKAAGLPLEEALVFWSQEYDKDPPEMGHTHCTHHWNKDSHRYVYSIQHLYGARGNRKNYSSHSCESLQSLDRSCSDAGGCPFAVFDQSHLSCLMAHLQPEDCQKIIDTNENSGPQQACLKYYSAQMNLVLRHGADYHAKGVVILSGAKETVGQDNDICGTPVRAEHSACGTSCSEQMFHDGTNLLVDKHTPFLKPVHYFETFSQLLENLSLS